MHQTFYIDIDEEISSMVDRLGKSISFDNYFVIPKRAIVLQSAVNLKLLKREAEKMGKHIFIVTADESGTALAQRSGLDVLKTLEGIESENDTFIPNQEIYGNYDDGEDGSGNDIFTQELQEKSLGQTKDVRLSSVGTSEFYNEPGSQEEDKLVFTTPQRAISAPQKPNVNGIKKEVPRIKAFVRPTISRQGMDMRVAPSAPAASAPAPIPKSIPKSVPYKKVESFRPAEMGAKKEKKIERIFSNQPRIQEKEIVPEIPIKNGKTKRVFFGFVIFSVFILAGVAAYLFVPSAVVTVQPNVQTVNTDLSINAGQNLQVAGATIPLKVIDKDETITLQYDATGKKGAAGQKAGGTVTIANSFSGDPQTLIATTRISTQDGKIFHLVKTVTVPGMQTVGGNATAGTVTADVVADQAGSDYDIDPTTFTIPGFQGSPKYDKFAVTSTAPMTGGTLTGDAGGQTLVVQDDIDQAKTKTEAALKQKMVDEIKATLDQGDILLDDAQNVTISKSAAAAKVGDMANNFQYSAEGSMQALVFSENDVRTLVGAATDKSGIPSGAQGNISKIEYGPAQADFVANTLNLQVHAETIFTPNIDLAKLKQDVLGKDQSQLSDVIKANPSIEGLNVTFNPPFMDRVPQYPMRVTLDIQK